MSAEVVILDLPARPQYVRLARLAAASLASRLGFNYDEVEDLRMAVDELCSLLVGPDGHAGPLRLTFAISSSGLIIEGQGPPANGREELPEFSRQILAALAHDYEVTSRDGAMAFRMVPRRQAEGHGG